LSCQNILVFILIIVGYIGWKITYSFLKTFFAHLLCCFGGEKENETEDDQGTYTKEKDVID